MKNIKFTIEYDGTRYNGWQVQHKEQRRKGGRVRTVQGVVEDALFNVLSAKVRLVSSGRTDSGVHATGHVANFRTSAGLTADQIRKALNSVLPADISVKEAKEADKGFNAQYDAISKVYRYTICNGDYISPFLKKYAYHYRHPLDVPAMKREARVLVGRHDFKAFRSNAAGAKRNDCVRTIKRLDIRKKNGIIEIEIEANGFLYNMARNIVGTLIEAGRGKFLPGSARRILKGRDRRLAGPAVPAKGLCLVNVKYAKRY